MNRIAGVTLLGIGTFGLIGNNALHLWAPRTHAVDALVVMELALGLYFLFKPERTGRS